MGKQKGEGGRSKARPSSSSLAASLLPSGVSSVGFGGYLGNSRIESSSSTDESSSFADIDSEVTQNLKRLGRKDPTTKLKALTSLALLFKQKPGEEVTLIVPQWAFEYRKLLHDYNRDVRRATHETMTSLVSSIGRGLAPNLKSLMGPWWYSQFDPITEVSQAARRSLEAAFPAPERRLDAMMLYVNEIFLYLDENLKLTPQSMSDKAIPGDELEDMHQRAISSSLLAAATLIDVLLGTKSQPSDNESPVVETKLVSRARTTIISSAELLFSTYKCFLEHMKSKYPAVRSATYSLLTIFIKHIPHAFNEGNMKMLSSAILGAFQEKDVSCHSSMWDMILLFSRKFPEGWSHCNIQKVVLSRFWHFLRNGCYGSQQISYPVLLLFLDSIPPNADLGKQFVYDLFQILWAGRDSLQSSAADTMAFFNAFRECFIWVLRNSSRYPISKGGVVDLPAELVSKVLVEALLHDYLLFANLKKQDGNVSDRSIVSAEDGSQLSRERSMQPTFSHRASYVQELGKCIVRTLLDLSLKEKNLLEIFCTSFQNASLEIIQQGESLHDFHKHLEQIMSFFRLLDQLAMDKGQTWPLHLLGRPLVWSIFPVIKSMDSPDAVELLSFIIELFGPLTIFSNSVDSNNKSDAELKEYFLHTYDKEFVPWCLDGHSHSSNSKLDLLINLIQDEYFFEQWSSIITYSTENKLNHVDLLTMLIEKVRERISNMKLGNLQRSGALPEHWRHKLLDSTAISLVHHFPSGSSQARFIRALLGGLSEEDQTCFLSKEALIRVWEGILKNLASILSMSSFDWAKLSCLSFLFSGHKDLVQMQEPPEMKFEMALFAFEILEGSIYCLRIIDEDCSFVSSVLATLFIIDWECDMASRLQGDEFSESNEQNIDVDIMVSTHFKDQSNAKLALGRKIHALRSNLGISFWKRLSSNTLSRLRDILVQTIRSAMFDTSVSDAVRVSSLCSDWVLNMVESIGYNDIELQILFDQLLSEGKSWPMWVKPLFHGEIRSANIQIDGVRLGINDIIYYRFVAFVDNLISSLGVSTIIAGALDNHSSEASIVPVAMSTTYSRAWLASEMLCSWKWEGGSVLGSLLPLLKKYAETENSSAEVSVMLSIINILIDGMLFHETFDQWISFDMWTDLNDEVENISNPYLRAFTSLLATLFLKDKVWGKSEAVVIFKSMTENLFVDTVINRPCLRVLPFILSIIIQPLVEGSELDVTKEYISPASPEDDLVRKSILSWHDKSLSYLSLGSDHTEDLKEWIQVVISCYPLNVTGEIGKLKVSLLKDINYMDTSLLLRLFRDHRRLYNASTASDQSVADSSGNSVTAISMHMLQAKLTAISVGYCWQQLDEDDWNYVLGMSQKWIEASVLCVEDMAESVDNAIVNLDVSTDLVLISNKIDLLIRAYDPSCTSISTTSLIIFCLLSQLEESEVDNFESLSFMKLPKWADIKDRFMASVLRLLFATGAAEAIAKSCTEVLASIVATSRLDQLQFWRLVASFAFSAPVHVKSAALESMELWGLSKGSISSLYAVLFSCKPIPSLQFAVYSLLSSEPISRLSLSKESFFERDYVCQESGLVQNLESSAEESFNLRDEISILIQRPSDELFEMDLTAQERVNIFIAWGLLLSCLHSFPSSRAREVLTQFIQDYVGSTIIDCIFQHIPLKVGGSNLKKKELELVAESSKAAVAAKHSITTCSLQMYIQSLWPVGIEEMASLAGSIYGLMIHLLPSYVRNWFSGLRDRSLSFAIESFTKAWCSPTLLLDELSQVKETVVSDENFSVTLNRTAYEIIATYKKEETRMDLIIRLPTCYPLRPVDVECTRSLGISEVKQRKWLLSLTAFVRNQNGAIAEAVRIWKSNLDKEFLGVEECPICYSILHTTNHSLPRLACKTCKHKFHSACLYKWFSTSHKSTCPLCQSPF